MAKIKILSGFDINNRDLTGLKTPVNSSDAADKAYVDTKAPKGAIVSSGLTQSNGNLLGRNSGGVGGVEEISIGSGLTLSGLTLSATGGGGGIAIDEIYGFKTIFNNL